VGVVFLIILVALTLASAQFGPWMLRNFIRDRGTQLTPGTFVATFVYAVLVLVSVGTGSHGDFVPHIGVTVTLGLMVTDLAVLIYFIHHTAISIQLPQVIASIATDLAEAIDVQGSGSDPAGGRKSGPSDRLVQRAFEKIRQASLGMPAVMIRQLEALARIMAETMNDRQRQVLLEQAAMIDRASERSVPEADDRADVRRRYEAVLATQTRLADAQQAT